MLSSIDVLPDRYPYRDDGCELSPSCLRCPLPQCKYDDPSWFHKQRRDARNLEVVTLCKEGLSVSEASSRFSLSQRTIFRILRTTSAIRS